MNGFAEIVLISQSNGFFVEKYGYGQWQAIRLAIRRNPLFRFDYFLRSLPVEQIGRRCEQLMKAAEKEVEQLEKRYREDTGLLTEPDQARALAPVQLPKHRFLLRQKIQKERAEAEQHHKELKNKVDDLSAQICSLQGRLKELNEGALVPRVTQDEKEEASKSREKVEDHPPSKIKSSEVTIAKENDNGGIVEGNFVEFPIYDGTEPPVEWKKPFTQFCIRMRKEVKQSLRQEDRKDKAKLKGILKDRWTELSEDDKTVWREWADWDKQRYSRELQVFDRLKNDEDDDMKAIHIPKKRKGSPEPTKFSIPKRKKL